MPSQPKPPAPEDASATHSASWTLPARVQIQSTAIAIVAFLLLVVFMQWAKAVLIPIVFSVFVSYALTPIVRGLEKRAKLPRAIGAALTLFILVGGLGWGISSLQPEALNILDIVPRATQKLSLALRSSPHQPAGAVEKMKRAASEIEKAANAAADTPTGMGIAARPAGLPKGASDAPLFKMTDYIWMGTSSVIAAAGQLVVVLALVYFLLIAGDSFRRTLVRISGDTLTKKKITVTILDEVDAQIQRYLVVQAATSALLAVISWLIFAWAGLENALFWGLVGGVLHLIPYAGPAAFIALSALVSYVQFDDLQPVTLIVGSTVVSIGVVGFLLVPWLTQKVGKINAVTVFVALLVWGWLWGIWGLLLGVPIVMAIKAICEHVEDLQPISDFLGTPSPRPQIPSEPPQIKLAASADK